MNSSRSPIAWPLALALAAGLAGAAPMPAPAQSLYSETSFQALTNDRRAYRVGDALTVLVYENASATASANTTTEKNNSLNLGITADSHDHALKFNAGGDSTGKGQIQRSGRLAAQITVTVTSIAPNGDLRVAGSQQILVNGETQLLQVEGRVRPIDVGESNTVASTRLADANITYVGDGILAEKQRQGVVARFLSWLGLM